MAIAELKDLCPPGITVDNLKRTHLKQRQRKLTEAERTKVEKANNDRRENGLVGDLSDDEVSDLLNPKLSDSDLLVQFKALRAYNENITEPALKECMTKSTKEIPSGKQLRDILEAVLKKCWANKEEIRIAHLVKSRTSAALKAKAANKEIDESKYRSSTGVQEMPENWMPVEIGPWLRHGDLADDRHPFFCLNVAAATESATAGGKMGSSNLEVPSEISAAGGGGIFSHRKQRALERSAKFQPLPEPSSDKEAMMKVHFEMTKKFMTNHPIFTGRLRNLTLLTTLKLLVILTKTTNPRNLIMLHSILVMSNQL